MKDTRPHRILLEARPGAGKTTVARRLVRVLHDRGLSVSGFTTEEIREGRRRIGFRVESVSGKSAVLAHVDLPGPPRVGKYGVDLPAFERVALPSMDDRAAVIVIDELGKMELASDQFTEAVSALFDRDLPIVATVHTFTHPFTDALKKRREIRVIRISLQNRDALPEQLAEMVAGAAS
jgi:nucleoside-triphosphatase